MSQPAATSAPRGDATGQTAGAQGPEKRFGMFGGVYTPSVLTILGVIMYLRFGWVVGNAGLAGAILIIVISHLISYATGLSIASIATNRTVGAGGAYYMVSRSLGAPAGAAIGIPLFFAQALSVTFYIVGFSESLAHLVPWIPQKVLSTLVNVGLTALSFKSAELAIKAQYFVMVAIGLSIVSFFSGTAPSPPESIAWSNPDGAPFATVFAVFFPAVTGIMAGVSMSGDLKDPRRAIPTGTLLAITTGFIIYMAFPFWLAHNATSKELVEQPDIVWTISAVPFAIYLGVWGATLSSALGSILTAPRTAQALAADGLLPRFLAKGYGPSNEPRVGTILTFCIAQVGILLGNLDVIAPILTMFFLATYGMTNLACGLERWAASPSFRPSFKVPALVSLIGGVGCFYVMSIINMPAMFAALGVAAGIYVWTQRKVLGTTYGDARHGIWSALVRSALQRLRRTEWHAQNWRPNLVILGGDPKDRSHLLQLGSAIVQDSGLVSYFYLIRGDVTEKAAERRKAIKEIDAVVTANYPNVFCRVDIVEDLYPGVVAVAQSYGIGTFEANTVMLGWLSKAQRADGYVKMLRDLQQLHRSVLLVKWDPEKRFGLKHRIHIWWGGLAGNGGLMLLLAVLLRSSHEWRNAVVTILTVVESDEDRRRAETSIHGILNETRLMASMRVVLRQGRTIQEIMHAESADADLAIVGMRLPRPGESAEEFVESYNRFLGELPTTILVHSSRDLESETVLFDNVQLAGESQKLEVPASKEDPGTPVPQIRLPTSRDDSSF